MSHNRRHRSTKGMLTLCQGIYEPASLLNLMLEERHRLTALSIFLSLGLVLLQHQ